MVQSSGDTAAAVVTSPTESELLTVFRSWLLSVLGPGWQAIQGQQNRAALPLGPFAVFTILNRQRIATNSWSYSSDTRAITEPTRYSVQVSTFGPGAGDAIQRVVALFRDFYTTDWFRTNGALAAPLFSSDPRQTGFVNDSNEFEDNWNADLHLHVNVTVTMPQQFATSVTVTTIEADTVATTQE